MSLKTVLFCAFFFPRQRAYTDLGFGNMRGQLSVPCTGGLTKGYSPVETVLTTLLIQRLL